MRRFAFFGDKQPDGKIMIVIVQVPNGETTGEVIDANLCADNERDAYLNEWLGVDRPVQPVYVRPQAN